MFWQQNFLILLALASQLQCVVVLFVLGWCGRAAWELVWWTVVGCMTHSSVVQTGRQGCCEVALALLLELGNDCCSSLALGKYLPCRACVIVWT